MIIIGAGISGLVCGCYLAKAGMKVLIVEQHDKPGGYCTSFKRKGFTFDAAAHSFGGYRKNGNMQKILDELEVDVKIVRYDPSDVLIAPDKKITFWSESHKTIQELQEAFPNESQNIFDFFKFLQNSGPLDFVRLRARTFQYLLDGFIADKQLKSLLSLPVLGNGGLPPSEISAFTASKIYTEFLLDGGYYPTGGMQTLSDGIARKFVEYGGKLSLSTPVNKIVVNSNIVSGVIVGNDQFLPATVVVSNCDARQTFLSFLDPAVVQQDLRSKLGIMKPSLSVFVVYLGIDDQLICPINPGVNVWVMQHYDIEKIYRSLIGNILENPIDGFMMRLSPNKKCLQAFINAPYIDHIFWTKNKSSFTNKFIAKIEEYIPNLSEHILYKDAASPYTMQRYTLNSEGAAYGWAGTPSQLFDPDFRSSLIVKNLYLTGHWTAQTQGVPGVAYLGYETAKKITKKRSIVL